MGKLVFFPPSVDEKKQHTNDADSHAKKHETMVSHIQADTETYFQPHKDKPPHKTVCKHFFFPKSISGKYFALLSNSFSLLLASRYADYKQADTKADVF